MSAKSKNQFNYPQKKEIGCLNQCEVHNYRYFKGNVDKKEKNDFLSFGRLQESLPFASAAWLNSCQAFLKMSQNN